jgi:hypothetical protein
MAVEFLDGRVGGRYHRIFRVFVVADTLYGGYALISPDPVVNFATATCASDQELELFLQANTVLDGLLADADFGASARRAAAVLGLDIAALDFLVVDGEVVLLEANPLWSPSFCWAGGRRGRRRYRADRERWHREAAYYCRWMDRIAFYSGMYALFERF